MKRIRRTVNKTELIFKIIEVCIAIVGLILVILGWIIPHRNSIQTEKIRIKSEKELEKIRWKKELIDKQISELYGPIYSLILEGEISFSRVLYQLGRSHVIPQNKSFYDLPENEQKIWKHYVDTYAIKNQMKIVEILRNNLHLVYNSKLPSCYKHFLDYSLGWELLDNQKRHGVFNYYEYHYVFNYPKEFNRYIQTTLEILLKEQSRLIQESEQIAITMSIKK